MAPQMRETRIKRVFFYFAAVADVQYGIIYVDVVWKQRSELGLPDAIVWIVLAVGVTFKALPRQPAHRRRECQTVVETADDLNYESD